MGGTAGTSFDLTWHDLTLFVCVTGMPSSLWWQAPGGVFGTIAAAAAAEAAAVAAAGGAPNAPGVVELWRAGAHEPATTNNRMEMAAIIHAMRELPADEAHAASRYCCTACGHLASSRAPAT